MSHAGSTGRRLIALAVVLLALPLLLAGRVSAQQHDDGGHGGHGDGLIPEGDWTDEQIQYMLDLIDETERVLPERFPTVATYDELDEVLGGMGFFEFGATAPGGYDHWINPAWVVDDHLVDPELSEALVYQVRDDGKWELVSAMFMLDPRIGMDEIPEDIAFLPGWHGHPELCVRESDGTFAGITDPENPDCPEGTHQATTPLMMHVWLFDPGCGHRFGGVGVGGLHCEHGGHGDGTTTSTTHGRTSTTQSPTTTTTAQPTSTTSPTGPPSPAPPSEPVVGEPQFTG